MKKTITFLLVVLLLVSPAAYAFSFSDIGNFFENLFGPADITGMAKGKGGAPPNPCGDGTCNAKGGENCATCAKDCACDSGYSCNKGSCVADPVCGDGTKDEGEECDDADLNSQTCVTQGFDGGNLACDVSCGFDTSSCYSCGDGTVNGDEVCEVGDTQSCTSSGYVGSQSCLSDCSGWDACVPTESCGDGIVQALAGEECDGKNLDGRTCKGFGYDKGSLDCTNKCKLDKSGCSNYQCGDKKVEGNEECDDGNSDNTDACLNDCTDAVCGDGFIYVGVENCENCISDVGRCNDYDTLPTISIKGGGDISFGTNNILITISDDTGCSVAFSRLDELIARRGKTIEQNVNLIEKMISCESANNWIAGYVRELPAGTYNLVVTAINNVGASGASVSFTITASPITITSPESEIIYTDIITPQATVSVTDGSSCSYYVNDCTQNFNCDDGLNEEDLLVALGEDCFNDKENKFSVTTTIGKESKIAGVYFSYMKTQKEYERLVKRASGMRMSLETEDILLYPTVGGSDGKRVNLSEGSAKALLAMNMAKGVVPEDSYNKIIEILANKDEIKQVLAGIDSAGWGDGAILGVAPAAQISGENTKEFKAFVSHTQGSTNTYEMLEEVHNLEVKYTNNMQQVGTNLAIVTFHSDPITIELEDGECMAVDLNNDTFEDVIACYNSEDGVTVNNIVLIDENMEPAIDESTTVISPVTYTTENTYVTTVDSKKLEKEFLNKLSTGEYSVPLEGLDIKGIEKMIIKKYSPFLVVITLFLVYVVSVISFSGRVKPLKKKTRKRKK